MPEIQIGRRWKVGTLKLNFEQKFNGTNGSGAIHAIKR